MNPQEAKALEEAATKLLHRHGYTWSGRPREVVGGNQSAFEKRMVRCPFRGKSRRG